MLCIEFVHCILFREYGQGKKKKKPTSSVQTQPSSCDPQLVESADGLSYRYQTCNTGPA